MRADRLAQPSCDMQQRWRGALAPFVARGQCFTVAETEILTTPLKSRLPNVPRDHSSAKG